MIENHILVCDKDSSFQSLLALQTSTVMPAGKLYVTVASGSITACIVCFNKHWDLVKGVILWHVLVL